MLKFFELIDVYKYVPKFISNALTTYIFPIDDRPILRFFFKSKKLKKLLISPNTHAIPILTLFIAVLFTFCLFICKFRKGLYSCGLKRYAKSP